MKSGVEAPAHIDSMTPTGNTDKPGGVEQVIALTVKPSGGEPYAVTMNQYIYPSAPFSAGEDITVRVDPDDPQSVMIWGGAERSIEAATASRLGAIIAVWDSGEQPRSVLSRR